MTIKCDDDGWMLHVNTELGYPHFFHLFDPLNVTSLDVSGDVLITFVGIGNEGLVIKRKWHKFTRMLHLDMEAAPKIGFNLTYFCPEGMVFNHDWFATPFILMTCQVIFIRTYFRNCSQTFALGIR